MTEPVTEPVPEPMTEPVTEPMPEPVPEPMTEPMTESVTESVTEPVPEPMTEPMTEPVTEPLSEPVYLPGAAMLDTGQIKALPLQQMQPDPNYIPIQPIPTLRDLERTPEHKESERLMEAESSITDYGNELHAPLLLLCRDNLEVHSADEVSHPYTQMTAAEMINNFESQLPMMSMKVVTELIEVGGDQDQQQGMPSSSRSPTIPLFKKQQDPLSPMEPISSHVKMGGEAYLADHRPQVMKTADGCQTLVSVDLQVPIPMPFFTDSNSTIHTMRRNKLSPIMIHEIVRNNYLKQLVDKGLIELFICRMMYANLTCCQVLSHQTILQVVGWDYG
jgi:hypothetical protein